MLARQAAGEFGVAGLSSCAIPISIRGIQIVTIDGKTSFGSFAVTRLTRLCLLLLVSAPAATTSAAQEPRASISVDMELVIAVDVSASMDREEFLVQRRGYVKAIRHPDFLRAIQAAGFQRIALSYVEWSSQSWQKVIVPWQVIEDDASAGAFAAALERQPLDIGRGTSISAAIDFGTALLQSNGYDSNRSVIDISGDGPNNFGQPVAAARDAAVSSGVVINGLPILITPSPTVPDVAEYYSDCVIGGPGSFVLPVKRVEEFAESIRRKLIMEIAGLPKATVVPVAAAAPVDCLAGEKMRERYADPYYPGLDD